jgi:hypothetical protein
MKRGSSRGKIGHRLQARASPRGAWRLTMLAARLGASGSRRPTGAEAAPEPTGTVKSAPLGSDSLPRDCPKIWWVDWDSNPGPTD